MTTQRAHRLESPTPGTPGTGGTDVITSDARWTRRRRRVRTKLDISPSSRNPGSRSVDPGRPLAHAQRVQLVDFNMIGRSISSLNLSIFTTSSTPPSSPRPPTGRRMEDMSCWAARKSGERTMWARRSTSRRHVRFMKISAIVPMAGGVGSWEDTRPGWRRVRREYSPPREIGS
jgi:hypothetical protein